MRRLTLLPIVAVSFALAWANGCASEEPESTAEPEADTTGTFESVSDSSNGKTDDTGERPPEDPPSRGNGGGGGDDSARGGAGGAGGGPVQIDCAGNGTFQDPATGHCYKAVPVALTQAEAEADCNAWYDGHLLSVGSDAEQQYLNSALPGGNAYFIGLSDAASEGNYQWSDGSPNSYTNWYPGEPNDANGNEDCAEIYSGDGRWNDIPCSDYRYYVCERSQ